MFSKYDTTKTVLGTNGNTFFFFFNLRGQSQQKSRLDANEAPGKQRFVK